MSTTTLKIPDALKARIADAAEQAGKSAHAFMVEALEAETRRAEMRRDFINSALKAEQEIARYGEVYSMDAVHRYFSDKLAGKKAKPPKSTATALKTRR
jgi:predicted transcriptional regulator